MQSVETCEWDQFCMQVFKTSCFYTLLQPLSLFCLVSDVTVCHCRSHWSSPYMRSFVFVLLAHQHRLPVAPSPLDIWVVAYGRSEVVLKSGQAGLWDGCHGWCRLMLVAKVMLPMGLLLSWCGHHGVVAMRLGGIIAKWDIAHRWCVQPLQWFVSLICDCEHQLGIDGDSRN